MFAIKADSVPPVLIQWTDDVRMLVEAVDGVLHSFAYHALITSAMEGVHIRASKHYTSKAVDFRIVWKASQEQAILTKLMDTFTGWATFIRETDHLHCEVNT